MGAEADGYQLLRTRLADRAAELGRRAEALNARRQEVFGAPALELTGSLRLRTPDDCLPRDLVPVGPQTVLLGTDAAEAMLSPHAAAGGESGHTVPGLLDDARFRLDLAELLRYYRDARLLRLHRTPAGRLLAVFRTGERAEDVRVLRWQLTRDGAEYLDNRGERDLPQIPDYDVRWTRTGREQQLPGRFPRISVADTVFVGTTGGSLTVTLDPDTDTEEHVRHREPVDEPLQSLADAELSYAIAGPLVLLRVRPYNEPHERHLLVNTRTGEVRRRDALGQGCRLLPADQGLVFPGGYELADGTGRTFRTDTEGLRFEAAVPSPNGEDLLYVFRHPTESRTLLLPWNTVRREASGPLTGTAHALLADGTLLLLRPAQGPTRTHDAQVWRTPFASAEHAAAQPMGDGPLERIGNAELVRGLAAVLDVVRTAVAEPAEGAAGSDSEAVLLDACAKAADRHHWLAEPELFDLRAPLEEIRTAAEQLGAEHRRRTELIERAAAALGRAEAAASSLIRRAQGEPPADAAGWVERLSELRTSQGELLTLRDLPELDRERLEAIAGRLGGEIEATAERAVVFLARPDAFAGPLADAMAAADRAGAIGTAAEAGPLAGQLTAQAAALATVTDVVTGLPSEDATVGTAVLLAVGEVLAAVNRARAVLESRRRDLLAEEHQAAFAAQSALLAQAVTAALESAGSPAECDDQLARLLLRLDDLDSRFADSGEAAQQLGAQREELHRAFATRRQALLDAAAARAERVAESGTRALEALRRRLATLTTAQEVHTCLAADPMALRVRAGAAELRELGDPVRAQEAEDALAAAAQRAVRALRDRAELSADGGATVRLGRHRFAVRREPVELTLVPDGEGLAFAVTGTGYRRPVRSTDFARTRPFWTQPLVSESPELYRAEYLATTLLAAAERGGDGLSVEQLTEGPLLPLVRRAAESAYDEGYERGVHDQDAAAILRALLELRTAAGLLRFPAAARTAAQLFWAHAVDEPARAAWQLRASSLLRARDAFGPTPALGDLAAELNARVAEFTTSLGLPAGGEQAGGYLLEELGSAERGFVTGAGARTLLEKFQRAVGTPQLIEDLRALGSDLAARHQLATAWLGAFAATAGPDAARADAPEITEAVALLCADALPRYDCAAPLAATVDGLLGAHPLIADRRLTVRIDELPTRAERFRTERVPAYRAYQRQRSELLGAERSRLRLDDYRPRPPAGFVRNQLIDQVYLPLIGDNLAKQLGSADLPGADRSGLLLLVSPPGYGKTTLMEYVADRLGLVMVRVDGPALGRATTSLDPDRAPDAAARREVEKIVFALEAGSNVLLYLDDIQHTSPELLQKFIPLCDAQRRIEAVSDGQPRSFDLRGRRFAVCLAGNPYTESGALFRIPDMLANRADVWNLGEVLSGRADLFALSFLENALTANPVLAPLAGLDGAELRRLVALAAGDPAAQADRLERSYDDLDRILAVLGRLLHVQRTVLAVNRAYIASAAQAEADRTEPPFLLQGSYRNMAKIAQRVLPLMEPAELEAVIDDHYLAEAQTLGGAAEANLLKLAELRGRATDGQRARWEQLKAAYA
ncbi:DNA repair ATPase, partial [Kitasatospora mediocidica]|uniref:DNA repair ATPase n=1 Tax=Kitasatospora mediocidica TaxID=58352 RepID=UPI00056C73AA